MSVETNGVIKVQDIKIDHLVKTVDEIKDTIKEVFKQQHDQWKLFFDREEKVKAELDNRIAATKAEMEKKIEGKVSGIYRWLVGGAGAVVIAAVLILLGFRH